MKEVLVYPGPRTEIVDSPIPKPAANQLVIKVVVSGSNPKDWKVDWLPTGFNQGDDIAGIVHEVGANVTEFKVCEMILTTPRRYIQLINLLLVDSSAIGSVRFTRISRYMVAMPSMRLLGTILHSISRHRLHLKVTFNTLVLNQN